MKISLSIFLFFIASLFLHAQTGLIKGKITDNDNLSIVGAAVYLKTQNKGVVSNERGEFTLLQVPTGEQKIAISFIGFESVEQTVDVKEKEITVVNIQLKPGTLGLSEIVVIGDQIKGQAKALNQQKNNMNVSNIVSADQIGRFPDANIGDAMKRISGITMLYDQGEARFGAIRGSEPRLNSVTLNGERVPSAEAETRVVQLDLVPADMIQTVEVNKALTPDMDADAIGGSVNLVTRSAPNGLRLSATAAGGYNVLRNKPIYNGSFIIGSRVLGDKLGIIASGSINTRQYGSDNTEGVWAKTTDGKMYVQEWDIRRYDLTRTRRSGQLALDYQFNKANSITFNAMYNWRDDWENRFRVRYALEAPNATTGIQRGRVSVQTKGGINNDRVKNARLEDQRMNSYLLKGEHLLAQKIKLDWAIVASAASEKRPDERYIDFRSGNTNFITDLSNLREPKIIAQTPSAITDDKTPFRRIEDLQGLTEEKDVNSKINLEIPVAIKEQAGSIKIGTRVRYKDKIRDNRAYFQVPTAANLPNMANLAATKPTNYTTENYLAGNYQIGNFASPEFLGNMDFNNTSLFTRTDRPGDYIPANFSATEMITAGYGMWTQNFGTKFNLLGGVRLEHTNIDYTGAIFDAKTAKSALSDNSDSYLNVLPSILTKYTFNENTVLKASVTSSVARPNYYDLVPYQLILRDDKQLEIGNPALQPTKAINADLSLEKYLPKVGIISGSIFYKNINDFIFAKTTPITFEGENFQQTQRVNGAEAQVYGVEVAFQRQLTFLPSFLKYLGIYSNYTYTGSNVNNPEYSTLTTLPGAPKHIVNASLSFDNSRFMARVAFNYTSDFLDSEETILTPGLERYYDEVYYLDANASYTITKNFRIFAEVNNLLNQPLRYFAGTRERTNQAEFYGARFQLGLKYDLTK